MKPAWSLFVGPAVACLAAACLVPDADARVRPYPSLETRVQAQTAIERVYYAHQIGRTRPFEEAVPPAVIERKVRTYLQQSVALERFWRTPVTAEALERELQRIAADTRMPGRLREIYRALDNNPTLVLECFVRPVLVDRLVHNFVQGESWDEWWEREERWLDPETFDPPYTFPKTLPQPGDRARGATGGACGAEGAWDRGSLGRFQAGLPGHTILWTGSLVLVWSGQRGGGGRYDPLIDTWSSMSSEKAPFLPNNHTAVWTGTLMLVWGGGASTSEGGRYDPAADAWTPMSTDAAPWGRARHSAVWTGDRMIVWGGFDSRGRSVLNSGGQYEPETDTWSPTSLSNAATPRADHTAVWTGSQMLVWGGHDGKSSLRTGARYDPARDTWSPMDERTAPSGRVKHTAVWSDGVMLVWGGVPALGSEPTASPGTGGRYDPRTDTWTDITAAGAPSARTGHVAIWTGSRMAIWGGAVGGQALGTGALYDPDADLWTPITASGSPSPRTSAAAAWTGELMIVWGGNAGQERGMHRMDQQDLTTGGRYNPATDTWTPTSTRSVPGPRRGHTAVWTGNRMIVWGGAGERNSLNTGGRYDPLTDSWSPTSTRDAPAAGWGQTAVWAGEAMIVWGGVNHSFTQASRRIGGRYDPVGDTWLPVSEVDAPDRRQGHTAVWTGKVMVVWGGMTGREHPMTTGARYDPAKDSWSPVSISGAPSSRYGHRAFWTGRVMVVWGGGSSPGARPDNSGARYDPVFDTWASITTSNGPTGASDLAAVWTGSRMLAWSGGASGASYDPIADVWTRTAPLQAPPHAVVWAGDRLLVWGWVRRGSEEEVGVGGQYFPASDTWTPIATRGAPPPRGGYTAVWTGESMLLWGGSHHRDGSFGGAHYLPGATKPEVSVLKFLADGRTLTWPNRGAGTLRSIVRGRLSDLPVGRGGSEKCLVSYFTGRSFVDRTVPPVGAGFWYLLKAQNACGVETYGAASNGTPRVTSACP